MASIVFAVAGSALGSSLGMGAVGAALVAGAGGIVGNYVDQAIFGFGNTSSRRSQQALDMPQMITSRYGQAIPVVYGSARVSGKVIWMSEPILTRITQEQRIRTGKFSSSNVTTGVERITKVDIALALTQVPSLLQETQKVNEASEEEPLSFRTRGALVGVRRLWADNMLIYDARTTHTEIQKTQNFTLQRLYDGSETQQPDPHITAIAGSNAVPAFRGIAYLLLTDVQISDYGNRVPNYTVEVVASLPRLYCEEGPEGLTEGVDGDVYQVNHVQRTITRFDKDSLRVKAVLGRENSDYLGTLKAHPWRIACAANTGDLWVTCNGDATIQRLNPITQTITATVACGNYPYGIVIATDGYVWITFPALNQVGRLNPATLAITYYAVAGCPWEICLGKEGDIWVSTNNDVVRLHPTTGAEIARIPAGLFLWGLAANPVTGEIWVSSNGEDVLKIISPTTNSIVSVRNTGTYPTDISTHPDDEHGSVAVTLMYGNQLKLYSRTYQQMLEYGTVAFPGPCLHLADGRVFISQTRYNFSLLAEGR